jgi:uncharacterized protein (TIGR02266 family)
MRRHKRLLGSGVIGRIQGGADNVAEPLIENISEGGLFVRTSDPYPVGTALAMEIACARLDRAAQVSGRVVSVVTSEEAAQRSSVAGMGIRFEQLPAETAAWLKEVLESLDGPITLPDDYGLNPAKVEPYRRSAFDFGLISLESYAEPEEPSSPAASLEPLAPPPWPPLSVVDAPEPAPLGADPYLGPSLLPIEGDSARLMVQVRGLLTQLDNAKIELDARNREVADLKAQLTRALAGGKIGEGRASSRRGLRLPARVTESHRGAARKTSMAGWQLEPPLD